MLAGCTYHVGGLQLWPLKLLLHEVHTALDHFGNQKLMLGGKAAYQLVHVCIDAG
jgi:hypothetical protein